jgi:hypothetical protein
MQRLQDLEAELAAFERQTMRAVTAEQKRQILQLAGDFPKLWAASTTTERDRKRILRLLVRDITVTRGPAPKAVKLHVCWQGGAMETLELQLSPNRAEAVRYPEAFVTPSDNWQSAIMTTTSFACCTRKVIRVRPASR